MYLTKRSVPIFVFGAVLVLAMSVFTMTGRAYAQSNVLVLNQSEILQKSKAGQAVSKQADERRKAFSKEVQAEQNKVKKAIEDYQKNKDVMSPDQRAAKQKELRTISVNAQQLQVQRSRELQVAVSKGQQTIFKALEPIVKDLVEEYKATVLVDRRFVIYAADEVNITAEAMKRLDAKLTTVKLEKVALDKKK